MDWLNPGSSNDGQEADLAVVGVSGGDEWTGGTESARVEGGGVTGRAGGAGAEVEVTVRAGDVRVGRVG